MGASLNHCKKMGAEPGRRFLKQWAAKLEPIIVSTTEVQHPVLITDRMWSCWRTLQDAALSSQHWQLAPTLLEWPCQEQRESGLTTSAPVLDVSAPAHTNGIWLLLQLVSVVQRKGIDH